MSDGTPVPRYSVVVPVRDEAETIGPFLRALRATLPPHYEVLVCHDDEHDATLPALAALPPGEIPADVRLVRNAGEPGPKQAIEAGMKAARAPVVVVMMADLSDDLPRVGPLVSRVEEGAAVACASRYSPGGRQLGGPWLKGLMSRSAGHLLHWLTDLPTTDPTNSFKAYSRAFLERTPIESRAGFSLALELTVKAHLAGARVVELPATWHDRRSGTSKFRLLRWLPGYLFWFLWGLQALLLPRPEASPATAPAASRERPHLASRAAAGSCRGGRPCMVRALAAVGLLAVLFLVWLDLPYEVAGELLDPSWRQALGQAYLGDLELGSELVFTGGPLGFLATQSFEDTLYLPRLVWALLWAAVAAIVTCRLLARLPAPRWRLALVALLLVSPPDPYVFILVVAVLLALADDAPGLGSTWFAASLAGVLATLKLSLLGFALALLVPLVCHALFRRGIRAAAGVALLAAGLFAALWRLAGQPLGGLGRFFSLSAELTRGYGGAMSSSSPQARWELALVVIALLTLAALRLALGAGTRSSGYLVRGALALTLLLSFKHGFTRQDWGHMTPFFSLGGALALALPALAGPAASRRRGGAALALAALALSAFGIARLHPPLAERPAMRLRHLAWNARGVLRPGLRRSELARAAANPPAAFRLDRLAARIGDGRVDLLTVQQGLVFLNRLAWHPRPVFQSYAAYTPRLAELNRAFLAGPRAPEWLLVRWMSLDRRLPSLDDGPALLEVLARYRPVDEENGYLLMQRAPEAPRAPVLGPTLWKTSVGLGDAIALDTPGAGATEAAGATGATGARALTLRLRPTLYGRLLGALLGAPELEAELRTDDGRISVVRIIPAMAESPFLVDPAAHGDRELDQLLRGAALPHPVSLRLLPTARVRAFYRDEVAATLYALPAIDPPR